MSPGDAAIRRARPGDARAIRRVARTSWHAAYDDIVGPGTVDAVVDEWYDPDDIADEIRDPEHAVFVAERDGVVGVVHAGPRDGGGAALYRIYLVPAAWREGIGSRLLERAVGDLRDRGCDRLSLGVLAENDVGVGFYESRGFDRVGEREVEIGGGTYVEYVYEKGI